MERWQTYSEPSAHHQSPYHLTPQQQSRDFKSSNQHHTSHSGSSYESYQPPSSGSQGQSNASSPAAPPYNRQATYNGDGDVPMQDADPYGRGKHSSRTNHQHQVSVTTGRTPTQYPPHEEMPTSRKFSPMDTFSPSSPYSATYRQSSASHGNQGHGNRQSPTRNSYSSAPQSYYSSSCMVPETHTECPRKWRLIHRIQQPQHPASRRPIYFDCSPLVPTSIHNSRPPILPN